MPQALQPPSVEGILRRQQAAARDEAAASNAAPEPGFEL